MARSWDSDAILSKLSPSQLIPKSLPPTSTHKSLPRRPMTPTLLSFRFGGARDTPAQHQRRSLERSPQISVPTHTATENLDEHLGRPVWSSRTHGTADRDPFASPRRPASPISSSSLSRPSTSSGIPTSPSRKVQRTSSIFSAASDAFSLKLGLAKRRGPLPKQVPEPVVLPDVIEISARKRDEEEEQERNRLRAEAAQAIGLDPLLVDPDVQSHHFDTDDDEVDDLDDRGLSTRPGVHNLTESIHSMVYSNGMRNTAPPPPPTTTHTGQSSSTSVGRYRSGSLIGSGNHSRSNSAHLTPVPPYPSNVSTLAQWQQHAAILPKYYHPSSLRIFALSNSKNWKTRYIMLTSPTTIVTRTRIPAVSYLHLFKSSAVDEKELERLVINEDSVVFVSDDEVGGRRHVIKVGGIEAGAFKKELNVEESGRTMWFLQIEDPAESQAWITGIKNSILNQRALRAGLLPASASNFVGNEPRGDIDVMLSMRAQGFFSPGSHSNTPRQHHSTPPSAVAAVSNAEQKLTYPSSISEHSVRSQASAVKPTVISVSTLRGFFSGSRPRSSSRAASVDTAKLSLQQQQQQQHENQLMESVGGVGNNLKGLLLRSATPDLHSQSSGATLTANVPVTTLSPAGRPSSPPFVPSVAPEIGLDRHIIPPEREQQQRSPSNDLVSNSPPSPTSPAIPTRSTKALSLGSMSLQPPPRRWTSNAVVTQSAVAVSVNVSPTESTPTPTEIYQNAFLNGTTGSLGALTYANYNKDPLSSESENPSVTGNANLLQSRHALGVAQQHQHYQTLRPPSVQSTSTYGTESSLGGVARTSSNASTGRTNSSRGGRRWSRQGQGSLPPRTSPPSGPPPNPPSTSSSPNSAAAGRPTTSPGYRERSNSRASSAMSVGSQQSVVSSLPSFKRASVSSVGTTSSTSQPHVTGGHGPVPLVRGGSGGSSSIGGTSHAHRASMPPPPRPAPTSALPPAPEDQELQSKSARYSPVENTSGRNSSRSRPRSVDSSVPAPAPKTKRASLAGRGFRLSMIAPSKPPPSSNLPPRPDELGDLPEASGSGSGGGGNTNDSRSPPPSGPFRRLSGGHSRLSRLNPIPASPDLSIGSSSGGGGNPGSAGNGTAPFPPPRGPLPPTPSTPDATSSASSRPAASVSRHTSLKQRLRILSAPSSSSTSAAASNTNTNDSNDQSTSTQASSNISNTTTNNNTPALSQQQHNSNTHTRHSSFASRFHSRNSSLASGSISPLAQDSISPPLPSTPSSSYFSMSQSNNTNSFPQPPSTPIGEKIMSIQDESSFLHVWDDTPMSPLVALPPPSPGAPPSSFHAHGVPLSSSIGMTMGGLPIRPLPAIPVSMPDMTPLSPPPRRNSKQLVMVDHSPPPTAATTTNTTPTPTTVAATKVSPPRTPNTPSVFEERFGTDLILEGVQKQQQEEEGSFDFSKPTLPHIRTDTFGSSNLNTTKLSPMDADHPPKQAPFLLSLPPSPLMYPITPDERSATPPDTPSCETHDTMSPSSPASIFSQGMKGY